MKNKLILIFVVINFFAFTQESKLNNSDLIYINLAKFFFSLNDNFPDTIFFSSNQAFIPDDLPMMNNQDRSITISDYLLQIKNYYGNYSLSPKFSFIPLKVEKNELIKDNIYCLKIKTLKIISESYTRKKQFKLKHESDTLYQYIHINAIIHENKVNFQIDSITKAANNLFKNIKVIFIGKTPKKNNSIFFNGTALELKNIENEDLNNILNSKKIKIAQITKICPEESILFEYKKQKLYFCDYMDLHTELSPLGLNDYILINLPIKK
jgi:hypothetical protein